MLAIWVAFIGGFFTILASIIPLINWDSVGSRLRESLRSWPGRARILLAAASGALIGLGIIWVTVALTKNPEVQIDPPANAPFVEQSEEIRGTARNIDIGTLWLVVLPSGQGHQPQEAPVRDDGSNQWSSRAVFEGPREQKFDVLAVLATEEAEQAFREFRNTCSEIGQCGGLTELPDGAVVVDRIAVSTRPPIVTIASPQNRAEVEDLQTVEGMHKNLHKGQVLWLTTVPAGGRYYPQGEPARDLGGGRWSSQAKFDRGGDFDILAVVAGEQAQSAFREYLTLCRDTGDCPGIERLPEDAVLPAGVSRVSVRRPEPKVRITSPQHGDRLPQAVPVRGTVEDLLEGQEVWVFAVPARVGWYYPQGNAISITGDRSKVSRWQRNVGLGAGPNDPERRFDIVAVVAGEQAQSVFRKYVRRCRQGQCPGIPRLPEDTVPRAEITVIRR
jgi:uncharacterized integral membrane protein